MNRRSFIARAATLGLFYGAGTSFVRAIGPDQLYATNPGETYEEIEPDDADWFASLKRTDIVNAKKRGELIEATAESCCDAGDGYPIRILEDAYPPHTGTELNGTAEVTDRTAKTLVIKNHDGTYHKKYRPAWTGDPVFKWPGNKLTRELEGNPTKTAWVFARINTDGEPNPGALREIYCIVPLPPGS